MRPAAIFPGCLVTARFPEYERSARTVLTALGYQLENLDETVCCGSNVWESVDGEQWLPAAVNLARAEQQGVNLITLCGSCTNMLTRARQALEQEQIKVQVNQQLRSIGLQYQNGTNVGHVTEVMWHRLEKLREICTFPSKQPVWPTYPCQLRKPEGISDIEDTAAPHIMADILRAVGAHVVQHSAQTDCCGATMALHDPEMAYTMARDKLAASAADELLVTACGNCQLALSRWQPLTTKERPDLRREVSFITDVVAQAIDGAVIPDIKGHQLPKKSILPSASPEECLKCGSCKTVCPAEQKGIASIPSLQMGEEGNPWACTACLECTTSCPQGIDVYQNGVRMRLDREPQSNYQKAYQNILLHGTVFPLADLREFRQEEGLPPLRFGNLTKIKDKKPIT